MSSEQQESLQQRHSIAMIPMIASTVVRHSIQSIFKFPVLRPMRQGGMVGLSLTVFAGSARCMSDVGSVRHWQRLNVEIGHLGYESIKRTTNIDDVSNTYWPD
jgi:hypothetical protein